MTLPHDISRCWDAACPQRTTCRRWLERNDASETTPHYATMRHAPGPCAGYLKQEHDA